MRRPRTYSPEAVEAARLLGERIRLARIERRWTLEELAERVGINHVTMRKVERGDMSVGMGPAFEAAVLVGVVLFHADPERRRLDATDVEARLSLLPKYARRPAQKLTNDF